jgi:hypothetical protein
VFFFGLQSGIPLSEQVVLFSGKELANNVNLKQAGVKEDDLLMVARRRRAAPPQPAAPKAPAAVVRTCTKKPHTVLLTYD